MDYYDRDGKLMSDVAGVNAWQTRTKEEFMEKRCIGRTDLRHVDNGALKKVHISTVWLGIDHAFNRSPPLIFETMIDDVECRYSTEQEAREGHAKYVKVHTDAGWEIVDDWRTTRPMQTVLPMPHPMCPLA